MKWPVPELLTPGQGWQSIRSSGHQAIGSWDKTFPVASTVLLAQLWAARRSGPLLGLGANGVVGILSSSPC